MFPNLDNLILGRLIVEWERRERGVHTLSTVMKSFISRPTNSVVIADSGGP